MFNLKPTDMKRLVMAIILAFCTLTLAAQDGIKVNYQGEKPTISDFAWAFLSTDDGEEELEGEADESFNAIKQAWIHQREGTPQDEHVTLTIDDKNGFVLYEFRYEESLLRIEMCYWNESDKKHKLFAYNVGYYSDGEYSPGQFDGIVFCLYDNAKREMTYCESPGFEVEYGTDDGAWVSYDLPRSGKDITVNYWLNEGKTQKTLKWDGRKFSF